MYPCVGSRARWQKMRVLVVCVAAAGAFAPPRPMRAARAARVQMNFEWLTPLYWKLEAAGTKALARYVPPGASVVELGARDGKHLHYLPRGVGAVMVSIAPDVDKGAARVSQAAQQALVFECSTSTHADGGAGAVNTGLPSSAYEVAFSIGALGRAEKAGGRSAVNEGVREAMRLLQPGGRLVFCEREDCAGAGASGDSEPEFVSLLRGTPGFVAVQAEEDGGIIFGAAIKDPDAPPDSRGPSGREPGGEGSSLSRKQRRAKRKGGS